MTREFKTRVVCLARWAADVFGGAAGMLPDILDFIEMTKLETPPPGMAPFPPGFRESGAALEHLLAGLRAHAPLTYDATVADADKYRAERTAAEEAADARGRQ